MINRVYQLEAPGIIGVKFSEIDYSSSEVLVRPTHMAICHADQRYFTGSRAEAVLKQKLPMALIHEAVGIVVNDPTKTFKIGDSVIMIPNVPGEYDPIISENYQKGAKFLSSSSDGFMQEFISLSPDRLIGFKGVPAEIASISEFISIAMHAIKGFEQYSHQNRKSVGIWGDGRLGYTLAYTLRCKYPGLHISIIGLDSEKLSYFTFADEVYLANDTPDDLAVDHAFECTGGEGCAPAIEQIIGAINPEGLIVLLGVSESRVPINTRMVLEKGIKMIGRSRSGRNDFEAVAAFLSNTENQRRIATLISEIVEIKNIDDIYKAFRTDRTSLFKTVLSWKI